MSKIQDNYFKGHLTELKKRFFKEKLTFGDKEGPSESTTDTDPEEEKYFGQKSITDKIDEYKGETDETFGLKKDAQGFYKLGNEPFYFHNDYIIVGKSKFEATDGLWELIISKNPKNYDDADLQEYLSIMKLSNAIYKDNNPASDKPKGNYQGNKWKLLKDTWLELKYRLPRIASPSRERLASLSIFSPSVKGTKPATKFSSDGAEGSGLKKKKTTIIIPSDPNALLKRFDLLMSSKDAGHTGVKNELVSICDELKRQRVLNTKSYKKLMTIL